MQAAEKKREKKRHAKKKQLEEKARREEEEVVRRQVASVAVLTEREKRALAAEGRLALQHTQDRSVQRWMCTLALRCLALIPLPPSLSAELGYVTIVGVAWLAWFHSTDCSITTVLCRVFVTTELS